MVMHRIVRGTAMIRPLAQRSLKRLPVFCRNLYLSTKGLENQLTVFGSNFRRYMHELKRSEWWPAEKIRRYQDARVREIVRHAYETVPFYRRWFDRHGVRPAEIQCQEDLTRLPVLTKQIVREHQGEMISRRFRGRRFIRRGTSGTTGAAVEVLFTPQFRSFQRAVIRRFRARFGVAHRDRDFRLAPRAGILPTRKKPPFWWHDWISRQTWLSPAHLTPEHVPTIVEWLCRQQYDFYSGWPNAMHVLANYMVENGCRLQYRPRLVQASAETLLPGVQARLAEAFGAPVTQQYSMTEFAGNMAKCEHGRFHLDFECCCVETQPVQNAVAGDFRRLIFTGWGNPVMPFIRYEMGDYGRPSRGPCPCGRASLAFDAIDGRTDDYVRTPQGRMAFGLNVHLPSAREVQVYQERLDEIEVRVVPGPRYDSSEEAEMLRRLRELLSDELNIRIVKVDQIPRSPSGKFRAVVSALRGESPGEIELAQAVSR